MTNSLLSCTVCNQLFRSRPALSNHVKHDHQSLVKVKFQNGTETEIKRGDNNTFKYVCQREFKHPVSLHKHTKGCNGELTSLDYRLIDEEISEEHIILDASESSDLDDNLVDDIPADCVGTIFFVNG